MKAFFYFYSRDNKKHGLYSILKKMKKIAVHLAEGFEEIEAVCIIDVLRRAGFIVTIVSVTRELEVTGSHQIKITADLLFEDVDYRQIDMLILPGGMPGSKNLKEHIGLAEQIVHFNDNGKPLGAICAAPLVLGNLGILNGLKATCYPGFEGELHGAIVSENKVEVSGTVVTGKGAGTAIEFALKIVEMFEGKDTARELARKMIVEV